MATKAVARLTHEPEGRVFFDYMAVDRRHRKNGICTEFVKFSAQHFSLWPELDIRVQSKVAQRVAIKLGYKKIGRSERYLGCELWVRENSDALLPDSFLEIKTEKTFGRDGHLTTVLYLRVKSEHAGGSINPPA